MQRVQALQEQAEAVGALLDTLGPGADDTGQVRAVNEVLSAWQDYYYGQFEDWNEDVLPDWESALDGAWHTAQALVNVHGQDGVPVVDSGQAESLPEHLVTGQLPWWYYGVMAFGAVVGVRALWGVLNDD